MSDFKTSVLSAINENNMISPGDKIIAALSGGADSVSLFNILLELKEQYGLTIMAAHVNHNLRGKESQRDENFVRDLCRKRNVQIFVKSVNVKELAEKEKISTELCGRNIRYSFFQELAQQHNSKIATAHTADDNAETIVFNLIRGAGVNGMQGILPVRDNIIRPLIYISRKQVEDYCKSNKLDFVTDSSNLTDDYTRNKIRHSIIPVFRELNPDFTNTAIRHSKMFRDVNSFLELNTNIAIKNAECKNGYDCNILSSLPNAVKYNAIYKLCKAYGAEPEYYRINEIASGLEVGGAVDLHGNVRAVCKQKILRFINIKQEIQNFTEIPLKLDTEFFYMGKKYSVKEIKNNNINKLIDISIIEKNPVFRTRRQGDTFTLPYRNVTKTLKKLFNELKIPEEKRGSLIVLALGNTVFWIEGVGPALQAMSKNDQGLEIIVN